MQKWCTPWGTAARLRRAATAHAALNYAPRAGHRQPQSRSTRGDPAMGRRPQRCVRVGSPQRAPALTARAARRSGAAARRTPEAPPRARAPRLIRASRRRSQRGPPAEAALPRGERPQRRRELGRAKVGPAGGREHELRMRGLPGQEVAQALLARRAHEQVHVARAGRQAGGPELRGQRLGRRLRAPGAAGAGPSRRRCWSPPRSSCLYGFTSATTPRWGRCALNDAQYQGMACEAG
jgi:hypothetical protein